MSDNESAMEAYRYPDGSITYPGHPVGPGGKESVGTADPSDYTVTVLTWTNSTTTPPGARQPNTPVIVEFNVDGEPVRAIGQVIGEDDVDTGDGARPVYCEELREPGANTRESTSQEWNGYRFEPV